MPLPRLAAVVFSAAGLHLCLAAFAAAAPIADAGALELQIAPALDPAARKALRANLEKIERRPTLDFAAPPRGVPDRALAERLLAWTAGRVIDAESADPARLADLVATLAAWPDLIALQRKAEQAMPPKGDPTARLAWFQAHPPVTGQGMIRMAESLIALGRADEAVSLLREGWRTAWIDAAEEKRIRALHGKLLSQQDYAARFGFLFEWGGFTAARRMLPLLTKDQRLLAEARLALRAFAPDVDHHIAQVPAYLKQDAGLVLDRAYWRRQKNLRDGARDMLAQPVDPMALERPEQWWRERHLHARTMLREGAAGAAYRMAADHGLQPLAEDGRRADRVRIAYAEAEWLAGWIALRFLDRPQAAQDHFQRLYGAVNTATSRSRAAYWLGRTALALKNPGEAESWFARAAQDRQRFYGQLAAEYLGEGVGPPAPPAIVITQEGRNAFIAREDVRAALMLHELDADQLLARFVRHIAGRAQTPSEQALAAALGRAINRPDLPLQLAKSLEDDDPAAAAYGYPVVELPETLASRPSLAHAIIRQESAFDHHAVSSAGARGLMQLMPATAATAARQAGQPFVLERLTRDPAYNMTLAGAHVAKLDRDFAGALVLMIAAYNAGESAVNRWVKSNGDPRRKDTDVVDWIESIPYGETRNYVQRVLEAATVYASRFGDLGPSPTLSQLLGQKPADKSGS